MTSNYCPTLAEDHIEQCQAHLATSYPDMLMMIVNHFFVDGAQHICMAMGVCDPAREELMLKEPRP